MNNKCPKCSGEMEEGFIPDASHASFLKPKWTTNIKNGWFIPKLENEHAVKTFRCTSCGYLESYAK